MNVNDKYFVVWERKEIDNRAEWTFSDDSWIQYRKVPGKRGQYFEHILMKRCRSLFGALKTLESLNDTYTSVFYIQYPKHAIATFNLESAA